VPPERQPHRFLAEEVGRRELVFALAGLMMGLFLAALNQSIVNTAMPRIVSDLHGFETYAWIITAYMLTSTSVIPIVGKLGDVYGHKPFLIGGAAGFVVTTALCGLAQDMLQLILLRSLQGIGGGVLMASAFAALAYVLPPRQRARMQGLFTGVFALSGVLGPLLGGYLTDNFSWRAVFLVNVPLGIAGVLLLWRGYHEHFRRPAQRPPIDIAGAIMLVLATVMLLLALSWGGHDYDWGSPTIIGLLSATALALTLFVGIELRAADPIVPLGVFRNNAIAISAFGATVQSMGIFGAVVFIPLFVQGVIGANATVSGSIIAPMTITMLIASVTNGQLIARTGRYKPYALGGFVVGTIGLVILAMMGEGASYTAMVVDMLFLGLGIGFVGPTLTLAAQSAARPSDLGVVTALLQFFRSIGNTVGTAIFGSIMTLRFVPEMRSSLSSELSEALPEQAIALTRSPQALVDPNQASSLRLALLDALPASPDAVELVFSALRSGLAGSLQWVFFSAAVVFASGMIATLFLREVPLAGERKLATSPSADLARSGRPGAPPAVTA
jgi:EmrB/QacA subfamily drug resistance transporter